MLLAIDMGNTDILIALHDGESWVQSWRSPSDGIGGFRQYIQQCFKNSAYSFDWVEKSIFSTVVPQHRKDIFLILSDLLPQPPLVLEPDFYHNFSIKIQNPKELGSDLLANAYAAYQNYKEAAVVVDFGTALSFTTISDEGEILGVSIAPGLRTAMKALFSKTAQLFEVPLVLPDSVIGKNTEHALQAGILKGYVGLVNEILNHIEAELGKTPKIIATGGLVSILEPLHPRFDKIDPLHTMEGLRLIAQDYC
ncbi:MAG: type III pantothenate kinase [Bacteroidota bacterium]